MKRTFFQYYFNKNDISCKEISEEDFPKAHYGFIIEDNDLTDYSRLVPHELRHHHKIIVKYFEFGVHKDIIIDNVCFTGRIEFDESMRNHPTLSGYCVSRSETFLLNWYNPYDKQKYSIKLHSELPYNYGTLGLYAIYSIYLTKRQADDWENICRYSWDMLNCSSSLFDTGGSSICYKNFNPGQFINGLISLNDDFLLEYEDLSFMKSFYNERITQALKIWETEQKRLFINRNNFMLD